jgi:hypothetical protein
LFSVFAVATQDYAISVDPIKDNEGQTGTARVMITNVGKLPLTNIVVNYGTGKVDKLLCFRLHQMIIPLLNQ